MDDERIFDSYAGTQLEDALTWASHQDPQRAGHPPGITAEERHEIQKVFVRDGIISDEIGLTNEWELTSRGRRIAQDLKGSRQSGALRRASVQKALLQYIDNENPNAAEDFANRPVGGVPVTKREIEQAVEALCEGGLIKGTRDWSGLSLSDPAVTPRGREAADSPRRPADFVNHGGTTFLDQRNHLQNYGHINAATAGDHATQTGNTLDHQERSNLTKTIVDLQSALGRIEDVPVNATAALNSMREEVASGQMDRPKLHGLFTSFMTALAVKLGERSYAEIAELAQNLGSVIG